MILLDCAHGPFSRGLGIIDRSAADGLGATGDFEWGDGAGAGVCEYVESAAHAVAACGQRVLVARDGGARQGGRIGRSFRRRVDEAFAKSRGMVARSVRVATRRSG